jgi:hypothetical protein
VNRIIENANRFDAKLAELEQDGQDVDHLGSITESLEMDEVFAFKDAIAIAQLEGRITLAEAETLQHVITSTGWRAGSSKGMRISAYLGAAELIGIDVKSALNQS